MKDKEAVFLQAHGVVKGVREFVTSQKALWQSIPWLALQAEGRERYDHSWSNCFSNGIWLVHAPSHNNGQSNAYVDLATGELIDTLEFHLRGRIVTIPDVEALQFSFVLDRLDASAIVHRMRIAGDSPFQAHVSPTKQEERRAEMQQRFKIEKVYQGLARQGK